jgi:hypothetical protein
MTTRSFLHLHADLDAIRYVDTILRPTLCGILGEGEVGFLRQSNHYLTVKMKIKKS